MLSTAHSGFTLLNFEGEVDGLSVALSMCRGKETRVVGRVPPAFKQAEAAANVEWTSLDDSSWQKKGPSRPLTILASLNEMIFDRGAAAAAREILQMTKSTTVLGLVYGEMTSPAAFEQLAAVASRVAFIEGREGGRIEARVRTVRKNGLIEEKKCSLSRGATGGLVEEVERDQRSVEVKREEKEEKRGAEIKGNTGMETPFEAAKSQEGLVSIHHGKVRVGGRVIYSADDGDDLDDSDPDDDLHI